MPMLILFILLLVGKCTIIPGISWWLVALPLYLPLVVLAVMALIVILMAIIVGARNG